MKNIFNPSTSFLFCSKGVVFLLIITLVFPYSLLTVSAAEDPVTHFRDGRKTHISTPDLSVEENTGAFIYTIPIVSPPGRNGIEPDLFLIYNSQNTKNEYFGKGWSINIPYIERINKTGTDNLYNDLDDFFYSSFDGELIASTTSSLEGPPLVINSEQDDSVLGKIAEAAVSLLLGSPKTAHAQSNTPVHDSLENKSGSRRANIKGEEVSRIGNIPRTTRGGYDIEVVNMTSIVGGVEVSVRAWDARGEQIGFGRNGSVDIERFVIINPPILVPDERGPITNTIIDELTGEEYTFSYREDLEEALLQSLEHTLSVKEQKFGSKNIIRGRVGNTTTTVYPDADPESSSVDGYAAFDGYNDTWANIHGSTTAERSGDSQTQSNGVYTGKRADGRLWLYRAFFLFDTSSIGSDTVDSATFSLYPYAKVSGGNGKTYIALTGSTPASDTAISKADYDQVSTTKFASDINTSAITLNTYNNWSLNGSGLTNIDGSGVSKFALRHGNDIENSAPTANSDNGINGITWTDYSGTTQDPKLVIEHSAPPVSTTTEFVALIEEGDFREYEYVNRNYWKVTDKNGTVYTFGQTTGARQNDPNNASSTFKWMLEEIRDTNDNYITFEYHKDNGQIYPETITYTGNGSTDGPFEVTFARSYNPDIATSTATGFPVRTYYKIDEIQAKVDGNWVRKYDLSYGTGSQGVNLLLTSVAETGKDENGNTIALPANSFEYNSGYGIDWAEDTTHYSTPFEEFTYLNSSSLVVDRGQRVLDINGDGYSDFVFAQESATDKVLINDTDNTWTDEVSGGSYTVPEDFVTAGGGSDRYVRIAEANGDYLPDLVISYNDGTTTTQVTYLNDGDGTGWTNSSTTYNVPALFYDEDDSGDAGARFTDVNGDGLQDFILLAEQKVYVNEGDGIGWEHDPYYILPTPGEELELVFADVNNDQLSDVVFSSATSTGSLKQVYTNNGDGSGWSADSGYTIPIYFYDDDIDQGARMVDVNNDGYVDIVQAATITGPTNVSKVYLNDGDGTGWTLLTSSEPPVYFTNLGTDSGYRFIDPNGDGVLDIVYGYTEHDGSPNDRKIYLNGGGANATKATNNPDLLNKVTNSRGLITNVSYLPTTLYKDGSDNILNPELPLVLDTVQYISVSDSLGPTGTTTYEYGGGAYYHASSTERRFAGFATTTITDPVGNVIKTFFHQGNGSQSSIGEHNDTYSKIGKAYRVEEYDDSNNLYRKTITKWEKTDIGDRGREYVKQTRQVSYVYDGDADHKDLATEQSYNNNNGNLSERIEYGEVTGSDNGTFTDSGSDKRTASYTYATNTIDYVIGLPSRETIRNNSGTTVAETRFYYDSQTLGNVTDGNLTKEERLVEGSTYIDREFTYNTYGLITQEKDPRDKATDYVYDWHNVHVATSTNAKNHAVETYYDYSSGRAATTTDINGNEFVTVYDALDRVVEEKVPDPASPSTLVTRADYAYTDTVGARKVVITQHLSNATSTVSYTYLDAQDRTIQERTELEEDNKFAVRDTVYDKRGNIATTSLPYTQSGSAKTNTTTDTDILIAYAYDPLGRVSSVSNTLGTESYVYDQWETVITDRENNTKDLLNDAFGNLVQVDEHNSTSTHTTSYTYDALDNLTKITDADSNVRNFTYDGLSRLMKSEDLHDSADSSFGSTTYAYDASGNVTEKTDPKNQTITYTYDDINRILTEDYSGEAGTEIEYGYDWCSLGTGMLCSATTTDIVSEYAYDALGNIMTETRTIDSADYTTSFTYDRLGNLLTVTYPDTSSVDYTYNTAGQLETVAFDDVGTSTALIVSDLDYNTAGQVRYKLFGNNVESIYTYNADELYRLEGINTAQAGGTGGPEESLVLEDIIAENEAIRSRNDRETTRERGQHTAAETLLDELSFDTPVIEGEPETVHIPEDTEVTETVTEERLEEIVPATNTETEIRNEINTTPTSTTTEEEVKTPEQSTSTENIVAVENQEEIIPEQQSLEEEPELRLTTTSTGIHEALHGKFARDRARIKGQEIAKIDNISRTTRSKYEIEIVAINSIPTGVEVFARVWDRRGDQIGFGKDGSVDIERFVIINPPILVADEKGAITRTAVDEVTGEALTFSYREDLEEALLQILEHTVSVKKQKFGNRNIVKSKIGNTTTIIYPDADPEGTTVDGRLSIDDSAGSSSWDTVHDNTGSLVTALDAEVLYNVRTVYSNSTNKYGMVRAVTGFDTSSIGPETVISATVSLYVTSKVNDDNDGDDFIVPVGGVSLASNTSLAAGDFDNIGSVDNPTELASRLDFGNIATSTYNDYTLNTSGIDEINTHGVTNIGWREGHDVVDSAISNSGTNQNSVYFSGADAAGTTQDPKLVVEHGAGSGGFQDISYTYDDVDNITAITDNSDTGAGKVITFTYDDLYRLISASTTAASSTPYNRTYSYSAIGNITNKSDQGEYTYSETGYATPHAVTDIGGTSLTYDDNGNVTVFGSSNYTWDYRNRLTQSDDGTSTSTYAYDHTVQRILKTVDTATTTYPNQYYNIGNTSGIVRHIFTPTGDLLATVSGGGDGGASTTTDEILYDDARGIGWNDWSYNCTRDWSSTAEVYSGTYAVECDYTAAWGGLFLNHSGYDTTGSTHIAFQFHSGASAPGEIIVKMHDTANQQLGTVDLTDYTGSFSDDTWYDVVIPLTDIHSEANATTSRGFTFISDTATTVHYDNIRFITVTEGESTATTTRYIHTDHLGSTNVVTDESGTVVQALDYYPFGERRINSGVDVSQREYTGHEFDEESELTYAKARYLDSDIGKWISMDPASRDNPRQFLTDPQQLNHYSYVRNNPINGIDPTGNQYVDINVGYSLPVPGVSSGAGATGGFFFTKEGIYQYKGAVSSSIPGPFASITYSPNTISEGRGYGGSAFTPYPWGVVGFGGHGGFAQGPSGSYDSFGEFGIGVPGYGFSVYDTKFLASYGQILNALGGPLQYQTTPAIYGAVNDYNTYTGATTPQEKLWVTPNGTVVTWDGDVVSGSPVNEDGTSKAGTGIYNTLTNSQSSQGALINFYSGLGSK